MQHLSRSLFFSPAKVRAVRTGASLAAAAVLAAGLVGCAAPPAYSDNGYPNQAYPNQAAYPVQSTQQGYAVPAQQVQMAEFGRVTQIQLVRTEERPRSGSGAGAIIGGVAGAIIGHQIGGGFGRDAATAVGAVGGAVAGNSIEKNSAAPNVREVYRVSIQLDNGSYRAYDIGGGIDLRVGDRVRIENGQIIRS
ncbi:hypothetical protein RD110_07385 [Rhodoferax koreense]|uniref:Glycine zipper 2TM domain-containing protein n=1 Tax=Rhodoferax koreensis TaxID=1842727 RepID=A0A1P8JTE5_9BURK|nr:glycine zipper 2TM domain-containing protein [Rhodoferax koreense]APW37042.1 hypothetical protein RD110_07385 [Rhodoferax koreense]